MSFNTSNLLYLITIVTFILALRFLSSPAHARRGIAEPVAHARPPLVERGNHLADRPRGDLDLPLSLRK